MKDDKMTGQKIFLDYGHHEIHRGRHFHAEWSVSDIGAATTPDDVISLSWKTPDTTRLMHLVFEAECSGGALVRLIKGKTGGGATPTGIITAKNSDDGSSITSGVWNLAATPAQASISYDATVFTGGTDLLGLAGVYLSGTSAMAISTPSGIRSDNEIILARNTFYQLSVLETGSVPATLHLAWYEHVSLVN